MYYIAFVFLTATAVVLARLTVAVIARLKSKGGRRATFWLVAVPIALSLNLGALMLVGDDMFFGHSPRCFLAVIVSPIVFLLSLLWFAFWGSRSQAASTDPRVKAWPVDSIAKRLGFCVAMLAVSILVFNWQLVSELKAMKADALATMERMSETTIPATDNAAVVYESLEHWDGLLSDVQEQVTAQVVDEYGEVASLEAMDLSLVPAARLHECEAAFDALRAGSVLPSFFLVPEETDVIGWQELPEVDRLRNALRLFAIGTVLKFERGDSEAACDDVRVLLRIGTQLQQGVRLDGQLNSNLARGLASSCLARMLNSERRFSDKNLRSFIDESPPAKDSVHHACRWTEAQHTVTLCNTYLDPRIFEFAEHMPPYATPQAHTFGQMVLRLAHAQDDIIALKYRNDFYRPFAKRMDHSAVNADEIVDKLGRRIPNGLLQSTDSRDFVIYTTMAGSDCRTLINLMAATALFEREHVRYPTSVAELVPDFITKEPVGARDGLPFHLIAVDEGLVICSSEDEIEVQEALNGAGGLSPDAAKWLHATQCLGKAYEEAHGLNAEVLVENE